MKILTKALMSYDGQTVSAEQIREIEELARQAREITEKAMTLKCIFYWIPLMRVISLFIGI